MLRKYKYDLTVEITLDDAHEAMVPEIMFDIQTTIERMGVTVLEVCPWVTNADQPAVV